MKKIISVSFAIIIIFGFGKSKSFGQTVSHNFNTTLMKSRAEGVKKDYTSQLFLTTGKDFSVTIKLFSFDQTQGNFLIDIETKWSGVKQFLKDAPIFK